MKKKIKVVEEQVKAVEESKPLSEADRAEEQRLFLAAKGAMEAHQAADTRWTQKQHEAAEAKDRAEEIREVAKRLSGEVAVVEAAAAAGSKWAAALSKQAAELDAERSAAEQRWSEAVEQWEKLRYSLGLPFYDPEVGPPAWFKSPYEQQGLSQLFSEQ